MSYDALRSLYEMVKNDEGLQDRLRAASSREELLTITQQIAEEKGLDTDRAELEKTLTQLEGTMV
ncbi:MAG: Nif11 family protein, partial [Chloroflexi bacterium]|nr:Nif11 family protein [Chloroflexota bacterium]